MSTPCSDANKEEAVHRYHRALDAQGFPQAYWNVMMEVLGERPCTRGDCPWTVSFWGRCLTQLYLQTPLSEQLDDLPMT